MRGFPLPRYDIVRQMSTQWPCSFPSRYDIVALTVALASVVFAVLNSGLSMSTLDELSTPLVCVIVCVFRRFRIDTAVKQLSTEGTYVGYEKYQKE